MITSMGKPVNKPTNRREDTKKLTAHQLVEIVARLRQWFRCNFGIEILRFERTLRLHALRVRSVSPDSWVPDLGLSFKGPGRHDSRGCMYHRVKIGLRYIIRRNQPQQG